MVRKLGKARAGRHYIHNFLLFPLQILGELFDLLNHDVGKAEVYSKALPASPIE